MTEADDRSRAQQYRAYLKSELDAATMYKVLAEREDDPKRAELFERLVEAEVRHARRWAEKLGIEPPAIDGRRLGMGSRLLLIGARVFGIGRMLPMLARTEEFGLRGGYRADPEARDIAREERQHARALRSLSGSGTPAKVERTHFVMAGGNVRAAVLGVNDGLVSNFSLVMGVAGGTSDPSFVLLAGVAGLLAGAFSMAAGEYVSVRSQRDMYEYQISREQAELDEWPEDEEEELKLIYEAKGLTEEEAAVVAKRVMETPGVALETMVREQLGMDPADLGSPIGASLFSFVAFVMGALIPILPYVVDAGGVSFTLSAALSAGALMVVGGATALMAGKTLLWGSLRMFLAGGSAAAVTYGVGRLIGVSIGG